MGYRILLHFVIVNMECIYANVPVGLHTKDHSGFLGISQRICSGNIAFIRYILESADLAFELVRYHSLCQH